LHRRASAWYAQQDYLADAIHHALLAGAFTAATELIERIWPVLWEHGTIATLFAWMQALPADSAAALWGRPSLYVSYAWGLALMGQIAAAEASLRQVEVTLQPAAGAAAAELQTLLGRAATPRHWRNKP
jgi:ATP/maltotriose-dependent transcriptional regulator MalT